MLIDQQTSKEGIKDFLQALGFFEDIQEEITHVTKPGEGNMNVVLRVETNRRSFIVKQSRPFVQKYQTIDAPIERIDVEYKFYATIGDHALLGQHFPKVLMYNAEEHTLLLEDLGNCQDMTILYDADKIENEQLKKLVDIAASIHTANPPQDYPQNKQLRLLNHQHIFELPFLEDNGFSLDDVQLGLEVLSQPYKTDKPLKDKIPHLGSKYLSDGQTLLHGDYYPGSWMSKENHIYIIDPEFSFLGFPEFDLGVLAAHAIIISKDKSVLSTIEHHYPNEIDKALLAQMTGVEIMRRLIGLAQLPISFSLKEKENLLQLAYHLVMDD